MAENVLFDKYGTTVDSNKVIFSEGEAGDKMYIIQEGSVRITKKIGGTEHILAVLVKGDFFGEMAIVNQEPRTATATAASTVRMLTFNREGFLGMIEKNGKIALNIIDKLCRRLNNTNQQVSHLVNRNEKWLIAMNLNYTFAQNGMEKAEIDSIKFARELSLNLNISSDEILQYLQEIKNNGIIRIEDSIMTLADKFGMEVLVDNAGKVNTARI